MIHSLRKKLLLILILGLILGITGCSGENGGDQETKNATGAVNGILETSKEEPVTEATVSIGDKSDVTNENGAFRIEEVSTGSATLKIKKDGTEFKGQEITINEGDNNLGKLIRVVFDPVDDYPIKDLANMQTFGLAKYKNDEIVNDYGLVEQSDGSWVGNFVLQAGTKYKLVGIKSDGYYQFPRPDTVYLIAGRENAVGEEGSYDWITSWDGAILTYEKLLNDNTASEIEGVFAADAEIIVDGTSVGINEVADNLEARNTDVWYFFSNHNYKEELNTRGTVELEGGVREERYTLIYQSSNKSWKISKFESYDAQTFTVTEENGTYKIEFDLQKAIARNWDFKDMSLEDYEKIVLSGEFNSWAEDSTRDYRYEFNDNNGDNVWELTISDQEKIEELNSNNFKVVGITDTGEFHYAPSGMLGDKTLTEWYELNN